MASVSETINPNTASTGAAEQQHEVLLKSAHYAPLRARANQLETILEKDSLSFDKLVTINAIATIFANTWQAFIDKHIGHHQHLSVQQNKARLWLHVLLDNILTDEKSDEAFEQFVQAMRRQYSVQTNKDYTACALFARGILRETTTAQTALDYLQIQDQKEADILKQLIQDAIAQSLSALPVHDNAKQTLQARQHASNDDADAIDVLSFERDLWNTALTAPYTCPKTLDEERVSDTAPLSLDDLQKTFTGSTASLQYLSKLDSPYLISALKKQEMSDVEREIVHQAMVKEEQSLDAKSAKRYTFTKFNPNDTLVNKLVSAVASARFAYAQHYNENVWFCLFHWHGQTGQDNALAFLNKIKVIKCLNIGDDIKEALLVNTINRYLREGPGNDHPHSFKTYLRSVMNRRLNLGIEALTLSTEEETTMIEERHNKLKEKYQLKSVSLSRQAELVEGKLIESGDLQANFEQALSTKVDIAAMRLQFNEETLQQLFVNDYDTHSDNYDNLTPASSSEQLTRSLDYVGQRTRAEYVADKFNRALNLVSKQETIAQRELRQRGERLATDTIESNRIQ